MEVTHTVCVSSSRTYIINTNDKHYCKMSYKTHSTYVGWLRARVQGSLQHALYMFCNVSFIRCTSHCFPLRRLHQNPHYLYYSLKLRSRTFITVGWCLSSLGSVLFYSSQRCRSKRGVIQRINKMLVTGDNYLSIYC